MSALVTHLLIGGLVALALRWEWKWVPLGMLLAELPDLDHFFGLQPRVHLHNLAFVLVLPLAVLAYLVFLLGRKGVLETHASRTILTLAAGAPALLSAHLVLDLVPQEVGGSHMALLYPFSAHVFYFGSHVDTAADPFAWSTLSVALLGVVGLVAFGHVLRVRAFRAAELVSIARASRIPVRIGSAPRHVHHQEPEPELAAK